MTPSVPRRRDRVLRSKLLFPTLTVAVVLVAILAVLRDDAPAAAADPHGHEEDWEVLEQHIRVAFLPDAVELRIETLTFAADGESVETPENDLIALHFAAAPSLSPPPPDAFERCDPLACGYRAPLDAVVHVRRGPTDVHAFAVDAAARTAHQRLAGAWVPHDLDGMLFRWQKSGHVPTDTTPTVTFRVNGSDASAFRIEVAQHDETRNASTVSMVGEHGDVRYYPTFRVVPHVAIAPFHVRVVEGNATQLAARTYEPAPCEAANFDVEVRVEADGSVALGDLVCVAAAWSSPNVH